MTRSTGRETGEPFGTRYGVPVAGGDLLVARAGLPPHEADVVVLAIHGIASSHMIWRPTVRALGDRARACVLAPDLRGRVGSAALPGPYGIAAHIDDLVAVLDDAGVEKATLVGHSMGAFIAAAVAAARRERVSGLVLVDGGLSMPGSFEQDADEMAEAMVDAALEQARATYASADEYVAAWRAHAAFAGDWNDDAEAYARYGLTGEPGAVRSAVSEAAVRADIGDLMHDDLERTAVERVSAPISLITAPRGLHDGNYALVPAFLVEGFAATHPGAYVERVADVNHYTMLLGGGLGPARVAAAIAAATRS